MPVEYKLQGQILLFQNFKRISKSWKTLSACSLIILAELFRFRFFTVQVKRGFVVIIYLFNEHLLNVKPICTKIAYIDSM